MGDQHLEIVLNPVWEKTRGSHKARHYAGRVTLMAASDRTPKSILLSLPAFRLESGEPLGAGLKRLSLIEIESAVTGFFDGEEVFGEAVHAARKSTKKLRALLRLIRYEVGEKVYRFENNLLRDTARLLSDVRSAAVVAMALEEMRGLYGSVLADGVLEETSQRLTFQKDRIETRTMEDPEVIPTVVANLERAYSRYQSWPVDASARDVYGIGIRDSFESIEHGLKTTFGRGRVGMVKAYTTPTALNFHTWRKDVKYFRHQLEMLTPLWPEVIVGMAVTVERVAELLGEEHDLHELLSAVASRPDLCPNPVERSLIKALGEQRRSDLQTASRILGRRAYAETPISLTNRFGVYWDTKAELSSAEMTAITY